MLDIGGQPCQVEPEFDKDMCTENELENKTLETFGCTSPFGANKDKICQDHENGSKVMDLYKETFKQFVNNCYYPCSFVAPKETIKKDVLQSMVKINGESKENTYVTITFKEYVKVTDAHYLYGGLSLIARTEFTDVRICSKLESYLFAKYIFGLKVTKNAHNVKFVTKKRQIW